MNNWFQSKLKIMFAIVNCAAKLQINLHNRNESGVCDMAVVASMVVMSCCGVMAKRVVGGGIGKWLPKAVARDCDWKMVVAGSGLVDVIGQTKLVNDKGILV
ncbi:hypothetical protein Acr_18g0006820 [Actinidia rufa]|uniref:Uncharacterized protein n=1 Tax=Actinidia rufa TaxID=165716 RepID=A0A7J0G714_9ERIC|nr:hypothetical protein Acr_18g0006820 [Actinidia rufa]